ncbi:MAG: hypothetical protein H7338_01200 [Candidatus Sericytochromatia bacterium]|nr:hypothetical protein [Candidatus Sericytochromatia bacterium]
MTVPVKPVLTTGTGDTTTRQVVTETVTATLENYVMARPPQQVPGTAGLTSPSALPSDLTNFNPLSAQQVSKFPSPDKRSGKIMSEADYNSYLAKIFAPVTEFPKETVEALLTDGMEVLTDDESKAFIAGLAKQPGLSLEFTGEASDVTMKNFAQKTEIIRQKGMGTLHVMMALGNGTNMEVASFSAISGPMNNGLLPNGDYKALKPVDAANQFPDETGEFGFKMVLVPGQAMNRTDLRIHSTKDTSQKSASWTEGCIGLNGGNPQNVAFYNFMSAYFKTHKSIPLKVGVTDNANVKTQLNGKAHY